MTNYVKELLINAFVRSLLQNFGTPMRVAALWNRNEIISMEANIYRTCNGVPRDIDNRTMMNVNQQLVPCSHNIERPTKKIISQITMNRDLKAPQNEEKRPARIIPTQSNLLNDARTQQRLDHLPSALAAAIDAPCLTRRLTKIT